MRAIEFRAWNTRLQEMEYIDDLYWFEENFCHHNGDNDYVITQYTGLKDAKGNKVFEGDILKSHMGDLVVTFTNGKFIAELKDKQPGKWDYHIEGNTFYQVDIVGNIYEGINEQKPANIGTDRDG